MALANSPTATHRHFQLGCCVSTQDVLDGSIGAGMTREVLSDTAELVQNRIRMTTAGLNLKQNMTERLSVQGRYNYKSFSDG